MFRNFKEYFLSGKYSGDLNSELPENLNSEILLVCYSDDRYIGYSSHDLKTKLLNSYLFSVLCIE